MCIKISLLGEGLRERLTPAATHITRFRRRLNFQSISQDIPDQN